jgi:hypothetical protein
LWLFFFFRAAALSSAYAVSFDPFGKCVTIISAILTTARSRMSVIGCVRITFSFAGSVGMLRYLLSTLPGTDRSAALAPKDGFRYATHVLQCSNAAQCRCELHCSFAAIPTHGTDKHLILSSNLRPKKLTGTARDHLQ